MARTYGYAGDESTSSGLLGLLAYLNPFRRAGLDFSVMYLPFHPDNRLLEIGCGSGFMLKGLADLGWQVEGIDFDPLAVEECRRKGLKVHLGTLEGQHYPPNSFDAIAMSHVIEHVPAPVELLEECRRILKTGGRLAMVTPNVNAFGHRLFGSAWLHLDPPRHLNLFTPNSFKSLLQKAGFRKIKIFTTVRDACETLIASRSIQRSRRYQMGSSHSRMSVARGRSLQTLEWVLLTLGFEVGEELALIVQKEDGAR